MRVRLEKTQRGDRVDGRRGSRARPFSVTHGAPDPDDQCRNEKEKPEAESRPWRELGESLGDEDTERVDRTEGGTDRGASQAHRNDDEGHEAETTSEQK